ncbi:MAG: ABC transporter permease [Candidatus Sedimenticola endophacoides]|uniref:ABC transporter permease n=2 Tax=Candidatus Sedimenticola endophacoides TaxID=2548426 RepID=A0A6N4DJC4_9GAMM|nr:MAG: ABC transporter permease [Candidatus Sedimenticola endophacoides]PUD98480.1 MAG: ABC transporter permease [Candidatus Sedimenticola endophacoides]PUE01494.1 MAG: ABC transporter permease [Candidatus Sedimenticola endophacoides]
MRLLVLAMVLAVSAVTAVGFFTNRVERALELQAAEVLAADLTIDSSRPLPELLMHEAERRGLRTARSLSFPSVIPHRERLQMVEVKAVSDTYPLRGELRIRPAHGAPEQPAAHPPRPGALWVSPELIGGLGLHIGETLSLGRSRLKVSAVLSRDTGQGGNLFRLGPRVLISLDDIPDTGLVTPASRVRHQLLIAGPRDAIEAYRGWAGHNLPTGARLQSMHNARPELRNALDRGRRFLALAAVTTVLVAGAAVALASRRFMERQSDTSAILRCLGATQTFMRRLLLTRLGVITLVTGSLGTLAGYLAQTALARLVGEWFTSELPAPDLHPLALGLGAGLITLTGFTLPPLLRLARVPPLRVLRRDLGAPPPAFWVVGGAALAALALLILWAADDLTLAATVGGGALLALTLLLATARLLVWLLAPLRGRGGAAWRYGLAGLARNPSLTAVQLTSFGLGLLALLLLAVVRIDLVAAWQRTIPEQAPNRFLINIQPDEVEAVSRFLREARLSGAGPYPMVRARLTHINGRAVLPEQYPEGRPRRLLTREFNLSWARDPQPGNRVLQGAWWGDEAATVPLFSVEQGLAEALGIALGDHLTFDQAGIEVSARVSNLRTVKWDNFQPNFFVVATPALLQSRPGSYITSFYLPPGREALATELVRRFPSVTVIDVSSIMNHVREIMDRGALAVEYVFLFTLTAGLLVLYSGIQASRESRRQEAAILRTLGLTRRTLALAVGTEFLFLGMLAGLLASLCATLTGWLVSTRVLELDYQLNPWIWLAGPAAGGIGIGLFGLLATYPLLLRPPLRVLRAE